MVIQLQAEQETFKPVNVMILFSRKSVSMALVMPDSVGFVQVFIFTFLLVLYNFCQAFELKFNYHLVVGS